MRFKQFLFGFFFFVSISTFAQSVSKEVQGVSKDVLFTIDDKPYYSDEFLRIYKKNLNLVKDESQKDLNQYLQLYVGYKLKVSKAYKLGLQNGTQYQNELKSYRTQLSKNYFNDTKITQDLIEEAYNRLQKEIKASHILILADENASPADSLKAYKKLEDIRKRALAGEDFGTLAAQFSEDPSAKENKGDLGYFTAFRMVYPFESAAYNTPVGQISKIFRTKFGFHIVKVNDIRNNRGEVTVAHIMILNPKAEDKDQERAKNTINDIYKKLQQGEKFEDLAKQFSEDKSSSSKGGVINKFSSGQLSSEEFEDVAFSLTTPGEISKPFQTQFGWHIIKLTEKSPMKTMDQMKVELETKVGKDDRSKKLITSLNEKLRKKYTYKRDSKQFASVSKLITNEFYEAKWVMPRTAKNLSATLLTINSTKKIDNKTFLEFVEKQQKSGIAVKPLSKLAEVLYDKFLDEQLRTYYDENLENEFPEFANVMSEYRDGLLLFDLMEKEIWERSKTDTIGLQKFYEQHKMEYMWKKRVDAIIVSSTKLDMIKKASSMLKKNTEIQAIKDKLNINNVVNIMVKTGVYEEGNDALPKSMKFEAGLSTIFKEGEYYFVTKVTKVIPEGVKTMEECKGKLVNDYQQYLEQHWVEDLRKEFTVKVNYEVFEGVKKQLNP